MTKEALSHSIAKFTIAVNTFLRTLLHHDHTPRLLERPCDKLVEIHTTGVYQHQASDDAV